MISVQIRRTNENSDKLFFIYAQIRASEPLIGVVGKGNLTIYPNDYANLWSFEVDLFSRNKGHGSSILEVAFELARQENCAYVALVVFKNNKDAIRLYERHGFEKHSDNGSAWEMVKEL